MVYIYIEVDNDDESSSMKPDESKKKKKKKKNWFFKRHQNEVNIVNNTENFFKMKNEIETMDRSFQLYIIEERIIK